MSLCASFCQQTIYDYKRNKKIARLQCSVPPLTAYPAMYGPMAHHYGNDVTALTPGSTEGSAHGKPKSTDPKNKNTDQFPIPPDPTKPLILLPPVPHKNNKFKEKDVG